ncbi:MAG: hypothetical protein M3N41_04810, partial [Acidobacteriota bacterium]|nr:hypothetical protein [Acidobacteriota bacterium]
TRRNVLRFAAGLPVACAALPAWAFASKEFWEAKPPSEWTSSEIDRLLTKSPWAKDASAMSSGQGLGNGSGRSRSGGIGFPGGGGGIGFPGGGVGFPGGGRQGGGYPGGGDDGGGRERMMATVRWESALPIQEALRIGASDEKPNADFEKYYVIALIVDLPANGERRRPNAASDDDDDSGTRADRRLQELKESARLERKDGPISLEKVEEGSRVGSRGPGVYFYFDRKADVSMDDKFVNFSTKLGRMEIKAKFTMKEMSYHGKLAV